MVRELVIEMTSKAFGTGFVSVLKYLKGNGTNEKSDL